MIIGIDARMYGLEHAGIGRYVINLIDQLIKLPSNHQFVLFLRQNHFYKHPFDETKVSQVLADIRHYSLEEQLKFPRILKEANCDLVHFPHFNVPLLYSGKYVVTVHDILWHQVRGVDVTTLPAYQYYLKYLGYRLVVRQSVDRAKKILTPSTFVKNELLKQYSFLNPGKIVVTKEAAEFIAKKTTVNFKKPYLIYTGSAYPHKNLKLLIDAISLINTQNIKLNLVIVSSRSVFLDKLKAYVTSQRLLSQVTFAGFLENEELNYAYEHAVALVHPSLSEGFGLTGLEAMNAGTPVIASYAGSLPEIYGAAALYFNPLKVDELKTQIITLLNNSHLRSQLIQKGFKQTQKYSWKKTAELTLKTYEQA